MTIIDGIRLRGGSNMGRPSICFDLFSKEDFIDTVEMQISPFGTHLHFNKRGGMYTFPLKEEDEDSREYAISVLQETLEKKNILLSEKVLSELEMKND